MHELHGRATDHDDVTFTAQNHNYIVNPQNSSLPNTRLNDSTSA